MAVTAGDLVVKLGAVTTSYNSKMQAARGTNTKFGVSVTGINTKLRSMGATASRVASGAISRLASGFGNITRKALGFAAALVGVTAGLGAAGLGLVLKKRLEDMDKLTKAARALGSSTEELGRVGFAAAQLGGIDTTQFTKGIRTMVMGIGEIARLGTGEALNAFGADGLDLDPAELARLSPGDMILELADAFGKLDSASAKVDIAGALFGGRNAQGFVNLLGGGREEIVRLGDEIERLGGLFSEDVGQGAERANDAMNRLRTSLGGLATQAATDLAPFIEVFSDTLTGGLVDAKNNTSDLTSEFGLFGEAVLSVTELMQGLAVMSLRAQATGFELLAAGFGTEDDAAFRLSASIARQRASRLESRDLRGELEEKVRGANAKSAAAGVRGLGELSPQTMALMNRLAANLAAPILRAQAEQRRRVRLFFGQGAGGLERTPGKGGAGGILAKEPGERGPRFAAAVEKGSVGAFSALLATLKSDPKDRQKEIAKNTKDQNIKQDTTNRLLEKQENVRVNWHR